MPPKRGTKDCKKESKVLGDAGDSLQKDMVKDIPRPLKKRKMDTKKPGKNVPEPDSLAPGFQGSMDSKADDPDDSAADDEFSCNEESMAQTAARKKVLKRVSSKKMSKKKRQEVSAKSSAGITLSFKFVF